MSTRTLVGVAALAAVLALAYYLPRERAAAPDAHGVTGARGVEPSATPPALAPSAPTAPTAASAGPQRVRGPARSEAAAPRHQPPAETIATIEQIRAATIPLERALAGLEEVKLRVQIPPNEEFRETLLQYVAEADDREWAPPTEAHILRQISEATGLSASDVQVDCRTTLCRVLLTRPVSAPNARYNGFQELVASFGLQTEMMMALPDETGTPINFAYVRRSSKP